MQIKETASRLGHPTVVYGYFLSYTTYTIQYFLCNFFFLNFSQHCLLIFPNCKAIPLNAGLLHEKALLIFVLVKFLSDKDIIGTILLCY